MRLNRGILQGLLQGPQNFASAQRRFSYGAPYSFTSLDPFDRLQRIQSEWPPHVYRRSKQPLKRKGHRQPERVGVFRRGDRKAQWQLRALLAPWEYSAIASLQHSQ